jgi:hypothetical protein
MGLGTHNTQAGDVVVVFLVCDIPILLQKHDDHYTVVGETYGMFYPSLVEKSKGLLKLSFSERVHGREGYRDVRQR